MKKKIFLMITLLVGIVSAQATNDVVVGDVTIPQGGSGVVNIELNNNDDEFTAYQFRLILPEGLNFVADKKGNPSFVAGDRYDDHSISSSTLGVFACISTTLAPISGTSGSLLSVDVTASADVAVGTKLNVTLGEIECTTSGTSPKAVKFEDVTFTVTIGDPADTHVVLDETSTTAPVASGGAVDIMVKRTIKANEWSTLVLPFNMTEAQVKEALGSDVQLAEFEDYEAEYDADDNVTGLTVNFVATNLSDGFYANYPYLVKTSKDITEFFVTATIDPDEEDAVAEFTNGKTGPKKEVYGKLIGTYHAGDAIPADGLFLSGNKFWYSAGATKIKAFRAYFMLNEVLSGVAEAKVRFMVDEDAAAIEGITPDMENGVWYTLDGRQLNGKPTEKGVYIVDGKKVLIK
ncbi:MAG: hypothetical protein Q4D25_09945 [Bacteroidales bacterium]|nr:hypothetical protein [Bacteroidales bacterium]